MTDARCPLHLFRFVGFAPAGDTVVSAAPIEHVIAVYGGGGAFGEDGLSAAFGGAAIFRNDATGAVYAGVWGTRNASRFRRQMRESMPVILVREAPDARLVVWSAQGGRPEKRRPSDSK